MGFEGMLCSRRSLKNCFSVSRWERQRALAEGSRQSNSSLLALQRQQICLFDHDGKLKVCLSQDQSPRTCITAPLPPKLIPAFPRRHVSLRSHSLLSCLVNGNLPSVICLNDQQSTLRT